MKKEADNANWEFLKANHYMRGRPDNHVVSGIVQHYTAAGRGKSLAKWLASSDAKVSAHIVICRDGTVIQQVKFKDRAIHAGEYMSKGFWKGEPQKYNANHFTLGIENSNYGALQRNTDGTFTTPYGKKYKGLPPKEAPDHRGKMRWWEPYTEKLIKSNISVVKAMVDLFGIEKDSILSHSDVSPHRKIDPGPLFPHDRILKAVFGNGDEMLNSESDYVEDDYEDEEESHNRRNLVCQLNSIL